MVRWAATGFMGRSFEMLLGETFEDCTCRLDVSTKKTAVSGQRSALGQLKRKHRAELEAPASAIHKIFVGQPADIGWLAGAGAYLAGSLVVEPLEAAGDSNSVEVKAGVARS